VVSEIAKGSGIAFASGEEMLVDTQNGRAGGGMPLGKLTAKTMLEIALHGGGSNAFPPTQPAAVDAVQVLAVDGFLEGFTGALAR